MLKERLLNDFKESMKNKDIVKKNVIQLVRSAILNKEKDLQKELTDSECEQVIAAQIKQRTDALNIYNERNITNKADETQKEIDILKEYLPTQLTVEELTEIIERQIIEQNALSIKDMGKVIKAVKELVGTRAEGKLISDIVKEKLN